MSTTRIKSWKHQITQDVHDAAAVKLTVSIQYSETKIRRISAQTRLEFQRGRDAIRYQMMHLSTAMNPLQQDQTLQDLYS